MTKTIQLSAEIPSNREISIRLPENVPVGPAELTLTIDASPGTTPPPLGLLLEEQCFGLWRDREDLGNGLEFAQALRTEAWVRSS